MSTNLSQSTHTICAIWQKDLRQSLYSLKGWMIFFFFQLFTGIFVFNYVDTYLAMTMQSTETGGVPPSAEQLVFAIFSILHFIFILVIPALTMSSFAEERKNQTYILLQTSPISTWEIVLGKYLANLSLMVLVLFGSSLFFGFILFFGNPNPWVIGSSYLGMFLLTALQLSFGTWVSSFCQNQFEAFIFTMLGLFFLLIINSLTSSLTGSDLLTQLIKYLGTSDHLDPFLRGGLSLTDASYFMSFSLLFLFFSIISLEIQRWR